VSWCRERRLRVLGDLLPPLHLVRVRVRVRARGRVRARVRVRVTSSRPGVSRVTSCSPSRSGHSMRETCDSKAAGRSMSEAILPSGNLRAQRARELQVQSRCRAGAEQSRCAGHSAGCER
jgi:hypothetical protein